MTYQEKIPDQVAHLSIQSAHERALLLPKAILVSLGFPHENIIDENQKSFYSLSIYSTELEKVASLKILFKKLRIKGVTLKTSILKPDDWLTRWKRQWKPARLTASLDVVPTWCREQYQIKKGRDYILMDTLLSFGTGLHETTQIMAGFIESKRGKFKTIMDVGTGTGILAMVALKNGAENVLAIDIGQLSVEAARANFKANGLRGKIILADIASYKPTQKFDFVVANLVTHDLMAYTKRLLACVKSKGYLAVSGISLENLPKLKKAYAVLPLKELELRKGKQWSGILYQKKT